MTPDDRMARFMVQQAKAPDSETWKREFACLFLDLGVTPHEMRRNFGLPAAANVMYQIRGEEAMIRRQWREQDRAGT